MVGVGVLVELWVEAHTVGRRTAHRTRPFTVEYSLTVHTTSFHFFLTVLVCLNFLNLEKFLGFAGSCFNVMLLNFVRSAHSGLPTCFSLEAASCSEGLEMPLPFCTEGKALSARHRPVGFPSKCQGKSGLLASWPSWGLKKTKIRGWGPEEILRFGIAGLCEAVT